MPGHEGSSPAQDDEGEGEDVRSADEAMKDPRPAHAAPTAWSRLVDLLIRPRASWSHGVIVVLCVALGFAIVVQVRQTREDPLTGMRQNDLVQLLDELTVRNNELAAERLELQRQLTELESGSSGVEAARAAAEQQAVVTGILAGTLPAEGPGVLVTIEDPARGVPAMRLVTVLEELRNAGAEAVELSGQRMTASSWIIDADGGLVVSGVQVSPPYVWKAIGDPQTLSVALDIPGGALAGVRAEGGEARVEQVDHLEIWSVRELEDPQHARAVSANDE